ncbi:MAG TPA: non-homologous end-joining DNA ligase [Jatrophihabitans sp.]|jgi:bifunctional non-homologous end joining protein LigD|nr:non-homologous end-joining DNA ligase [Jatrophihabitans sp.]
MTDRVEVTHADRVIFPDDGITKGDVVAYYRRVAPAMLRLVRDRPLTLQRFPRGIAAQGFIQQDIADSGAPDWLDRVEVPKQSGGTVVHAVANRADALAWLANQNCLTPHVWLARTRRLDHPDLMVFDLDPSDRRFVHVRDTAFALRDVLTDLGFTPHVQLTGSRGVHVVAPLSGESDFDHVRAFARDVAEFVAADDPAHRTTAARKAARGDRVYLDIMRNGYAQTTVAPYAVRARPGAPVATPLEWDELAARGVRADRFTVRTLPRRLDDGAEPWRNLRRHARSLIVARRRLDRLRSS